MSLLFFCEVTPYYIQSGGEFLIWFLLRDTISDEIISDIDVSILVSTWSSVIRIQFYGALIIFLDKKIMYLVSLLLQEVTGRINPILNGRGCSVLIWGKTCRTMLEDKGKPLAGDKGTCTDKHGPKTWQGIMARVQTNVYAYAYGLNCIRVRTELKCVLYSQ